MKKNTILITGGAGFIGSCVNLMLADAGFNTVILDNLSTGNKQTVPNGKLIIGDLGDRFLLDQIFKEYPIDAVMHFAAKTNVGESVQNPSLYYQNNVASTLVMLDSMQVAGIKNLIFSSSAAVYGFLEKKELTEEMPCSPINPYGSSKLMIETILKDYEGAYGIKSCSLRYFNAAGADPLGRIKYLQKNPGNLIPILLRCILENKPFTLFGDDYQTPDGSCIRDFVHIADIGQAHILALKKLLNSKASVCYNLGNKQGNSVLEVIAATEEVTGKKLEIIRGKRREGDPPQLIANAEKARKELGWAPKYPDIKEMIKHAWKACQR